MTANFHSLLCKLASLRLTLVWIGLAVAVALLSGNEGAWPVGVAIALPFGLLFVNLLAALATNATLRSSAGLLGFHLALATLALLAAADRLTGLTGHVEVTEGAAFDPALVEAETGPLHPWGLEQVRFVQGSFAIDYAPGMRRRDTVSTVLIPKPSGGWRPVQVGDDTPLVIGDYRFYTTFNKGFAPLVTYVDEAGTARSGAIHLPSYPLNYYKQGNDWAVPGNGRTVKLWLHLPDDIYEKERAWNFRKPENAVLVVMVDGARHELRPGDGVALGGGRLRYEELRTWMGYTIAYNPIVPWMLATVAVAVLCLAWHVAGKLVATPWAGEAAPAPRSGQIGERPQDGGQAYAR